jgi:adenylosuccinate lyase
MTCPEGSMKSWKTETHFRNLLKKDREVRKYLSAGELDSIFDLRYYLKNVDYIFDRVFGPSGKQ